MVGTAWPGDRQSQTTIVCIKILQRVVPHIQDARNRNPEPQNPKTQQL